MYHLWRFHSPQSQVTNTMQLRFNANVMIVWLLSVVVLWFTGGSTCVDWAVNTFASLPIIFCFYGFTAIMLFMTSPLLPSDGALVPTYALQEFAWTEEEQARVRAQRPAPCTEPIFVVQTALKTFVWSCVLYDYSEARACSAPCANSAARCSCLACARASCSTTARTRRKFW
jgi:hypothetical protein